MIQEALHRVINNNDLTYEMARQVMMEIMTGSASDIQMASYLTALRMKGESIDEITASASVMRDMAAKIDPPFTVMDIVGTGGDEVGTFNISTTAAFVVAAAGINVAKHGNRSVSSKSGAADVLEALGANLSVGLEADEKILEETNICFLYAPCHHSSMKNVAPVRKGMKERTLFNILGPLANPAKATMQLLGVYDDSLVVPLAEVLQKLGVTRGLVVCGNHGMDEVTLTGETKVCEIRESERIEYFITPEQYGFNRCQLKDLQGGDPQENAEITKQILQGKDKGPKYDVVVFNAALAIYLGKENCSVLDCISVAKDLIDSGKAYEKLEQFLAINAKYSKLD